MSLADELRTAGLTVIGGRSGIGRTSNVTGVTSRITGTAKSASAADDVNRVVVPARGVAYIERSGRVWLLADGPVESDEAVVWLAAYRDSDVTDEQTDALAAVEAVLSAAYGVSDGGDTGTLTDAATGDSAADQTDKGA